MSLCFVLLKARQHVKGHYATTQQGAFVWVKDYEREGPTAKPKPTRTRPTRTRPTRGYEQTDRQGDFWRWRTPDVEPEPTPEPEPEPEPESSPWGKQSPRENAYHEAAFTHPDVPEVIRNAVLVAPNLRGIREAAMDDTEDASSCYYSHSMEITMHARDFEDDDMRNAIWRHEYGHHVDFMMGRSFGEFRPESSTVGKALEADNKHLHGNSPKTGAKLWKMHDKISNELQAHRDNGVTPRAALRLLVRKHGLDPDDTLELIERKRVLPTGTTAPWDLDRLKESVVWLLTALETGQAEIIPNTLPYCGEMRMFQDFLGSITKNRLKFPCSHSNEYYKDGASTDAPGWTDRHTREAYADWFDLQAAPARIWRQMAQKLAPKTCNAFMGLTSTYVEKITSWRAANQGERHVA